MKATKTKLFGDFSTPEAKARLAKYEAELQANASDVNWLEEKVAPSPLADQTEVTIVDSGKVDSKGRKIGYKVGTNTIGGKHYAWCQNARFVKGEWVDFGVFQRSKEFPSIEQGKAWGLQAAQVRSSKIK